MFVYFLANFLTFEPYYMWVNAVAAFSYFWKMYFFFKMVYDNESQDTIDTFYAESKYTVPLGYPAAIAMIGLKYSEWGVLPVYTILGWGGLLYLEYYNYTVIKEWGNSTDTSGYFDFTTVKIASDRKPTSRGTPTKLTSAFDEDEQAEMTNTSDSQIKVILI